MHFILQSDEESDVMCIEIQELLCEMYRFNFVSHITVASDYFDRNHGNLNLRDAIPVGSLQFVQKYLKSIHGIDTMDPIEVPKILREERYLLRDYRIYPADKIPKKTLAFIKDVSVLKRPTLISNTKDIDFVVGEKFLLPGHLYQVSGVLDIISEYRVIVMDDKVLGIQFYDGDPTVMPNEKDILKIKEMVLRYSISGDRPGAYGMDVAVVRTGSRTEPKRDLALIEIQPFVSMGTYGCRGAFLPRLYKKGLEWYLKVNQPVAI